MGDARAPALLLVHGTAASTHSFRDLMPRLSARFRVIAIDLPGHGFTDARDTQSLTPTGMAMAVLRPAAPSRHPAGRRRRTFPPVRPS
ncbi:MAG: alpha/beta fold hydrolase [Alphaproteobacteria bacterium]|nr:alpha/beta fold hydrolase [Alphaproteobacteria bacterium]